MNMEYYKKFEPFDGKWYITRKIDRGAFGVVFEVERRDVKVAHSAMKIISVPSSSEELGKFRQDYPQLNDQQVKNYYRDIVDDFENEFELMSKLKGNSHIVSIEDCDVKAKKSEIGWDIFIRMELLTTVTDYFKEHPQTREDVIRLGIDICKALESCQKYKIVHRDIKPSNIFVTSNGAYKLGDFGVARVFEKTMGGMSQKGTPVYMAPELYRGEADNANVDLYSLGIVMYMFLNDGFEPFWSGNTATDREQAFLRRLQGREPIPAPAYADEKLARIVLKACSYRPEDRYQHPSQMRRELATLLNSSDAPASGKITAVDGNIPEIETSGTLDKAMQMFPPAFDSGSDTPPEKKKQSTPASGEIPAVGGDMPEIETAGTLDKAMQMFPLAYDVEPDTPPEEKPVIPPEPERKQNRPDPTKEIPEPPAKPTKLMEAFQLRISDESEKKAPSVDSVKKDDLVPIRSFGKWGFADKDGAIVIPCIYESYEGFDSFFDGGDIALVKKNGSWGAINRKNEEVIPFIYDLVYHFDGDIAPAKKDGKWGAINKSGQVVIPFQYENSRGFNGGIASVQKNGRWGAVNHRNEVIVPFMYEDAWWFENGFAPVRLEGRWGVINKTGKASAPFQYDYIFPIIDGAAIAQKDGKWGIITPENKILVPLKYEEVTSGPNGRYGAKLDGKWGAVDRNGKVILDFKYECLRIIPEPAVGFRVYTDDNDFYRVRQQKEPPEQEKKPKPKKAETPKPQKKPELKKAEAPKPSKKPQPIKSETSAAFDPSVKNTPDGRKKLWIMLLAVLAVLVLLAVGLYALLRPMDAEGNDGYASLDGDYSSSDGYGNKLASTVDLEPTLKNGKYGFADEDGNIVIPCMYDNYEDYDSFKNGGDIALVRKGEKWGVINRKNEAVIPFEYDYTYGFDGDVVILQKGEKYGVLNKYGEEVIPFVCNLAYPFQDGVSLIKKGDKWGAINNSGEVVIPFIYDDATKFEDGFSTMEIDGKWGALNSKGEQLIPFIYDNAHGFHEGVSMMKKDEKWGGINTKNKTVIPFVYEDIESGPYYGFYCVKKDGKWGAVNKNNETVMLFQYEDMMPGISGYVGAQLNGKWGVIDKESNTVLDFVYDCRYILPCGHQIMVVNEDFSNYYIDWNGDIVDD